MPVIAALGLGVVRKRLRQMVAVKEGHSTTPDRRPLSYTIVINGLAISLHSVSEDG